MPISDPIRPTDAEARALARRLIDGARFGALGVLVDGAPHVTRIAIARDAEGWPQSLISDLSLHTQALKEDPRASLLLGEPGAKGDPLTHPRLTLEVTATFVEKTDAAREAYLAQYPKARLYFDFADFHLVTFVPNAAHLNGGFGKAYRLARSDLEPQ